MIIEPSSTVTGRIYSNGSGAITTLIHSPEAIFLIGLMHKHHHNKGLLKGFGYDGSIRVISLNHLLVMPEDVIKTEFTLSGYEK